MTDYEGLHHLAGTLGPIDIAIDSAGIAVRKLATATTKEEWDSVISVNLDGAVSGWLMRCTRCVKPPVCY